MTPAVWMMARSSLRRQWSSLVIVALLTALVAAVVIGTLGGARRSASAFDRLLSWSNSRDFRLGVFGADPDVQPAMVAELSAAARAIPGVVDVAMDQYAPVDLPTEFDTILVTSADGTPTTRIGRPLVLAGRLADPTATDEIVINELAARELDLSVGDKLSTPTMTPAAFRSMMSGQGFLGFEGPQLHLTVVGKVRFADDLVGHSKDATPALFGTAALASEYADQIAWVNTVASVVVDDPAAIEPLRHLGDRYSELGLATFAATPEEDYATGVRDAIRVLVAGLLIFAAAAIGGGLVAIGQAAGRQVRVRDEERAATSAMGLTRKDHAIALALPAMLAIAGGCVFGAAIAYSGSGLFPLAVARRAEPNPGLRFDPVATFLGVLAIIIFASATAYVSARRECSPPGRVRRRSRPRAAWFGLRPGPVVRLGSDRALGGASRPGTARLALLGASLGVAGVVAVLVVADSLRTSLGTPARWGWAWTSMPDVQRADDTTLLAGLAKDPGVAAAGVLESGNLRINGTDMFVVSLETTKGDLALELGDGRLPVSDGEVALGATTMDVLGVHIGDAVTVAASDGSTTAARVVGQVAVPMVSTATPGEGGVMTRHAVQAKAAGIEMDLVITYADGVDRAVFEQHLTDTYGLSLTSGYSRPNPPSRLTNIDEVVGLLPALGAFLAVLALLGLGHSLTVASRAGRREYGVLSALGLIRRRAGHVVTWHSAIIAMVGLMIGVPIGITVGRIGWNLMTSNLGMLGGPATPWAALGATAVVSLALALLIAWPVAHHFTRGRPADLLRAE